jgi:hypothetical protein
MKTRIICTAILCAAAPFALLADDPATPTPGPGFADLAGNWKCTTTAGSWVRSSFVVGPDGNIVEHQEWGTPSSQGVSGTWDQTFSYSTDDKDWTVKNVGSNGWIFTGTADPFDGDSVTINGSQDEGGKNVEVRERYQLDSSEHFDHTWERNDDGVWIVTSEARCDRDHPAT